MIRQLAIWSVIVSIAVSSGVAFAFEINREKMPYATDCGALDAKQCKVWAGALCETSVPDREPRPHQTMAGGTVAAQCHPAPVQVAEPEAPAEPKQDPSSGFSAIAMN
jgi:hypothetical protein